MNASEIRRRLSVWWRRRKVERAYAKIAEAELNKTHGFTPTMMKTHLLQRNGYVEYDDGEFVWTWPDDRR